MKVFYSVVFAVLLTAPHLAFAAPAASNDPICVGTERIGIIGDTPFCKKLFDKKYGCPDETFLDFYPDPPICRFDHGNKEAGSAFLKSESKNGLNDESTTGSSEKFEVGSSEKSKIDPDENVGNDFPVFIGNDVSEWINSNQIWILITVGIGAGIGLSCYAVSEQKRRKSKYTVKPLNGDRMQDLSLHDSITPTQKLKSSNRQLSTNVSPVPQPVNKTAITNAYTSLKIKISSHTTPDQKYDPSWNSPIIVIDTNILYDYAGIRLDNNGNLLKLNESEKQQHKKIQKYLDLMMEKKVLYVPIEVFGECKNRMNKIRDGYKRMKAITGMGKIINYVGIGDDISDLHNDKNYLKIPGDINSQEWKADLNIATQPVYKFYEDIHSSTDQKIIEIREKWEVRKRKFDPSISLIKKSPNMKNDREILATALQLKNVNPDRRIELLSCDGDFTIFKQLIKEKFDIGIIDGFK